MMILLLPIFISSAAATITLPKVNIDKKLLEKYGVMDDVNQPEYVEHAFNSFNAFRKQFPGSVNPQVTWSLVESTAPFSLPVLLARQWIILSGAANAQNLMQIIVAHFLNISDRFRQTAEKMNLQTYGRYKQLNSSADTKSAINECSKDRGILDMAHTTLHTKGATDPVWTCEKFLAAIRINPDIIKGRMAAALAAHRSLEEVVKMVQNGELYTFGQIGQHLKNNPIVDSFNFPYFKEAVLENLRDYNIVMQELQKDPGMKQIYESIARRLDHSGIVSH